MSNPPSFSVPSSLSSSFTSLIARMLKSGMAEVANVYGPQAHETAMPSGRLRATSRRHVQIGALTVAISVQGANGNERLSQEGERVVSQLRAYWQPDARGVSYDLITDANYADRWLVLPQRSNKEYRISACTRMGVYYYALLDEGATFDPAGGVK